MIPLMRTFAVLVLVGTTLAAAPPVSSSYLAIDLGKLEGGGDHVVALGINDRGQVVGESAVASGFRHAFLWQRGRMVDLGVLPGDESSSANDINNRGQVVGVGGSGPGFHALLWDRGEIVNLQPLGASASRANAINQRGQIVGFMDGRAVLWDRRIPIELETPPGAITEARDINDRGIIAGTSIDPTTNLPEAVIWKDGQIIPLGTLPGDDSSAAIAVNNRGQVVGVSSNAALNPDPPLFNAFLWEDGVMTALGAAAGDSHATAVDINDRGQIVGTGLSATTANTVATLFYRGTAVHVRDQGSITSEALAINNRGEIVGTAFFGGTTNAAVIWVPTQKLP